MTAADLVERREERDILRQQVARLLQAHDPQLGRLPAAIDAIAPRSHALEREMALMGLFGLPVPEEYGGQGANWADVAMVAEALGGALVSTSYFATTCQAVPLILGYASEDQARELLTPIAEGSLTATVALAESGLSWNPADVRMQAVPTTAGEFVLTGDKWFVIDATAADLIVVVARSDKGDPQPYVVDRQAEGVTTRRLRSVDPTREVGVVELREARGRLLARPNAPNMDRVLAIPCALLAAEMVGVAARCLQMALDYSCQRVQFGRRIAEFQATRHRLVDMFVDLEAATSIVELAVEAIEDDGDVVRAASIAKGFCSDALWNLATSNIHVHGALGFTWEHEAHFHFKRLHVDGSLLGTSVDHRRRVAALTLSSANAHEGVAQP